MAAQLPGRGPFPRMPWGFLCALGVFRWFLLTSRINFKVKGVIHGKDEKKNQFRRHNKDRFKDF